MGSCLKGGAGGRQVWSGRAGAAPRLTTALGVQPNSRYGGVSLRGNRGMQGRHRQLPRLDTLRGGAALGVAWFHMTNGYQWGVVRWSGYEGRLGVACFFVISGFAIPYSMHTANYGLASFWRFLARRLVRLEPAFLGSIGVPPLVR